MKHILGMVRPHLDFEGNGVRGVELDYLRLIYAVSELRKQGDNAKGYVVVVTDDMLNRLARLERDYQGKKYAQVLSVSIESYLRQTAHSRKIEILSGMMRAAITDTSHVPSNATVHRSIREFILKETILSLEPDVIQVKEKSRFPFGVRWDYYGVIEDARERQPKADSSEENSLLNQY